MALKVGTVLNLCITCLYPLKTCANTELISREAINNTEMEATLLLLALFPIILSAQNQNWTMGRTLKFTPPITINTSAVNQTEGTSCLSDAAGTILCYSDGVTAYDRNNNAMPNGTGLTGHTSTSQSALIVQQPNNPNILYLFTLNQSGTAPLYYSVVDMTLNSGLGDVTAAKNVVLNATFNMRECLSANYSCTGDTVWITTKRWQSANFYSYPLTSTGVGAAVISSAGFAGGTTLSDPIGTLAFHPDGNRLSVCYYGNGRVETYSFNKTTGVIQLITTYFVASCYDSKWAENLLYVFSNNGKVNQINVCTGTVTQVGSTPEVGAAMGTGWYGNDGRIYISRGSYPWLSTITNPLTAGVGCGFTANSISLPRNPMFGLQNIAMPYTRPTVSPFNWTSSCGQVNLTANPRACFEPCTYRWVSSAGTVMGTTAVVNLPNGTHNITLERVCDCETVSISQDVIIGGGLLASAIGF